MTREEAKTWLNKLYARADITDEYGDMEDMQPYEEAVNMAIEALEQEHCDDVISRQAVFEMAYDMSEIDGEHFTEPRMVVDVEDIQKLPSVNPQEPCEDSISREDALMALTGEWTELTDELIHKFIIRIKNLPPVTPQPKTGHWIPIGYDGYADGYPVIEEWECSECGFEHSGDDDTLTTFCPNCGARMAGDADDNR